MPGLRARDRLVVQAEAGQAAGTEVLDEDVRALRQRVRHGLIPLVGQVEGDRPLVAVDRQVVRAVVAAAGRHPLPGVVTGRALDLDDVGPEVAEHHGGVRAGQDPGEVGDHDAGQRSLRSVGPPGLPFPGCWVRRARASSRCCVLSPRPATAPACRYTDTCPPICLSARARCQVPGAGRPARAGDLGVRPGLPQRPVRRDLPRRADQPRQVLVDQRGDARLGGVHGHVHRGAHLAVAVAHRHRHRADPGRQLLVGERPAARPDRAQLVLDAGPVAGRCGGQAGTAGLGQRRGEGRRVQRGQQDLALGRLQRGEPGADDHPERDDLRNRDPGHVDDVGPVELGHRRGLPGLADEVLQVRAGHVPQAE